MKSDIDSLVTVVEKTKSEDMNVISSSQWACYESFNKTLNLVAQYFYLYRQDNNTYPDNFKSSDEKHVKSLEYLMMSLWGM